MINDIYKLARPLTRGVRVDILSGKPYMQKGEQPIANLMVNEMLNDLPQFVGDLVVGNPVDADNPEMTQLFLDSPEIVAPFVLWVWDMRTTGLYDLKRRLEILAPMVECSHPSIQPVEYELIESVDQLAQYKQKVIVDNFFPGVVLREPFGTFGTSDETIKADAAPTETIQ